MRFLSNQQVIIYNKLVRIAGGDPRLVEDALRAHGSGGNVAQLEDVVRYIQARRKDEFKASSAPDPAPKTRKVLDTRLRSTPQ